MLFCRIHLNQIGKLRGLHFLVKKMKKILKKGLTFQFESCIITHVADATTTESGCGAAGSALDWGSRGREFKSRHSDHFTDRGVERKWLNTAVFSYFCEDFSRLKKTQKDVFLWHFVAKVWQRFPPVYCMTLDKYPVWPKIPANPQLWRLLAV